MKIFQLHLALLYWTQEYFIIYADNASHICDVPISLPEPDVTSRLQRLSTRCTRRFNPGVCSGPVNSVWTFDFFRQNCTERLGCVLSSRSNRFASYAACHKKCRAFIDLFTQTLTDDGDLTNRLRSDLVRREDNSFLHSIFYEREVSGREIEPETWDSPVVSAVVKDDTVTIKDVVAPDIDYAGVQVDGENCDLLHHGTTTGGLD